MKTERDLAESVVNVHMPLTINFNAIENEDEVPSESNSSSPKSKSDNPIRSFDPGANENRSLPETPGSKGGSKRTLEQSVHIQKRSRFSLDFGTEAKRCEAESATAEELKESSSPNTKPNSASSSENNLLLIIAVAASTNNESADATYTTAKGNYLSIDSIRKNLQSHT